MSDREDAEYDAASRRRRPRACDQCRRRKVRCDGSEEDGRTCSTCVSFKDKCTYTAPTEVRKRRYVDEEYVRALESEVTRLRMVNLQLQAQVNVNLAKESSPAASTPSTSSTTAYSPPNHSPPSPPDQQVKEEEPDDDSFLEGFKFMSLNDNKHVSFMGRSSNFPLISAAIKMKAELVQDDAASPFGTNAQAAMMSCNRRPEFWTNITDFISPDPPYTDFPDPVVLSELLETYYQRVHPNYPLLHWPTFLQSINSGLHLTDEPFGAVLLLVCALGARFSTNPATLPAGATNWQWAGWQWYDQVRVARKLMPLTTTTLYDLQLATLAGAYVASLAVPHANYSIVGHGLRLAQDLGAHRRMTYSAIPTVEGELRKRAFWCLIAMDRAMCTVLGRPCSIQDEEFDLDYPIECDDEYWVTDDPQQAFKQPPGKPAMVIHFIQSLKLTEIHTRALRTIYSLQGARDLQDPQRAQQMVADLDSDLNKWEASIPEHLRYSPTREDNPYASQAASLYAAYCNLRIFIHRPFIMMTRRVSVPFPSLAICTNAARSCIQVLDRHFILSGGPVVVYQYHLASLFSAAIILLLHVSQGVRAGTVTDAAKECTHVRTALRVLKNLETYWSLAGRFWDILNDLMTALESAQRNGSRRAAARTGNFSNFQFGTTTTLLPGMQPSIFTEQPMQASSSSASSPVYGCGMSSTAPSTLAPTRAWQSAQAVSAADAQQYTLMEGTDPDLDAIFAELLPTLPYDDALAAVAQQLFPINTVFDGSAAQPVLGDIASAGGVFPSPATIAQAYGAYVPSFGVSSGGLRSDVGVRGEDEDIIG
ncbi:Zn(II)2Cys6 transcription factor [Phanerochaete sordida]|uniref:Zn(II)2Cys6 transcription factor n=1 Tax=Phanerochaete sordida TaxID=48140 RepID=A0A9P3LCZ2_9APHY|nr:Zn(II)2Cys6 transcription factor [Phanerochaete sordida]